MKSQESQDFRKADRQRSPPPHKNRRNRRGVGAGQHYAFSLQKKSHSRTFPEGERRWPRSGKIAGIAGSQGGPEGGGSIDVRTYRELDYSICTRRPPKPAIPAISAV